MIYATLRVMIGAVDVGGTKTLVAVFDESGKIVEEQRFETSQNYDDFIADLQNIVNKLTTKIFKKTCVAIPGIVDRDNGIGIRFGNLSWQNVPIQADLEKLFRCPVIVENDAKAAGLYEAKLTIKEFKKVLYVTIGTGIGLAYILNGKIDSVLGDRGGNQFQLQNHGKLESWEAFASGKAIVQRYGKIAAEITEPNAWRAIAHNLGLGIWTLVALVEPEVVIIGGGVGSHFNRFGDFLREDLESYATPVLGVPKLRQASKPEEAVVYGCFEMAKSNAKYR